MLHARPRFWSGPSRLSTTLSDLGAGCSCSAGSCEEGKQIMEPAQTFPAYYGRYENSKPSVAFAGAVRS
jgi:hypothetical protein